MEIYYNSQEVVYLFVIRFNLFNKSNLVSVNKIRYFSQNFSIKDTQFWFSKRKIIQ